MGIFSIFQTSLRAMNAYSGALSVIGNNVANSSNENYSKQRVEFTTLPPDVYGGLETGRGITISSITQSVDNFLEKRITDSVQTQASTQARSEFMTSVDALFNETDGSGLSAAMNKFFDNWTALSAEPESIPQRNNLLKSAENLVNLFHQYATSLNDLRGTIDDEIGSTIPTINNKLEQIQEINQKILDSDAEALSYKDLRRQYINDLSKYMDINVVESGDDVQIYTKRGVPLINGVSVATLSTIPDPTNSNLLDIRSTMGGTVSNITDSISQGRLSGLIEARDTDIKSYMDDMDTLAYTLVTQVNTLHTAGFDLAGGTGSRFFGNLAAAADAASSISIDAAVDGLPSKIAASGALADIPGGNTVALSLAELSDSNTISFGGTNNSFNGYFGDLLSNIGADVQIAQSNDDFSSNVLDQVKLQRTQTSGVNVDEEQIDLVRFQAAFQASGRLIQIADTILQTLIQALG